MKPTHKKRAYYAEAIQWTGDNFWAIARMMGIDPNSDEIVLWGGHQVILRHSRGSDTLHIGDWVVKCENREVKRYTDAVFNTKYEMV